MNFRQFLRRVRATRVNRYEWKAQCPAHDDPNRTLVLVKEPEYIQVMCGARCSWERLARAVGVPIKDFLAWGSEVSAATEQREAQQRLTKANKSKKGSPQPATCRKTAPRSRQAKATKAAK
jgi:hypothetical protein